MEMIRMKQAGLTDAVNSFKCYILQMSAKILSPGNSNTCYLCTYLKSFPPVHKKMLILVANQSNLMASALVLEEEMTDHHKNCHVKNEY
jgi:hypothetical protein